MKRFNIFLVVMILVSMGFTSCTSCSNDDNSNNASDIAVVSVNSEHFATDAVSITIVPCTLSDGTKTDCYQIITNSTPSDHQMGPWCPDNIADGADAGGIWLENGEVYDVDGAFVENMAAFYEDDNWLMYDENGDIYVTDTEQDCINAANPAVGEEYENFCVECLPSYITDISQTYLIPITPVIQDKPTLFLSRPEGGARPEKPRDVREPEGHAGGPPGQSNAPSTRGIALNGVEFSAPAPVDNILGAYTLAPFDDAGGHINVHQGYHYHAATGVSLKVEQEDGHAALIGYALDGYGIYENKNQEGIAALDLDELRGHTDITRGYHYHVDSAGNNNFINGLKGAYAN